MPVKWISDTGSHFKNQILSVQTPMASLANRAPVKVFTGFPCPNPVYVLYLPGQHPREVKILSDPIELSLAQLRSSIENMHRAVSDQREKITLLNKRKPRCAQEVNFLRVITSYDHGSPKQITGYMGRSKQVADELLEHVSAQGTILKVHTFVKHRFSMQSNAFELLISWCSLESIEVS
ncbi:hypothetical protein PHMEG_00025360 [Phytophthora megakarya]|uniref:Uncharacterized protein n=1 Tax=Phytophthora megakarya TaxID=4795 RepID=A0A225VC80_9STRA|nr:hypothetical protein PHMEG_00025360 [Phytophthora megakarya]